MANPPPPDPPTDTITFGSAFGDGVIYAIGAHQPSSRGALTAAGFVPIGITDHLGLPAGTDPLDAMLRLEYAADLLSSAGFTSIGIGEEVTRNLELAAAQADADATRDASRAAELPLMDFADAVARHLPGYWGVTLQLLTQWGERESYTRDLWSPAQGSPTKQALSAHALDRCVVLVGPYLTRLMVTEHADRFLVAPLVPYDIDGPSLLPRGHSLEEVPVPADPKNAAAVLTVGLLPAYEQAAHRARLLLVGHALGHLGAAAQAWEAFDAQESAREPMDERRYEGGQRQRDRASWSEVQTVLRHGTPLLERTRDLADHLPNSLNRRSRWSLESLDRALAAAVRIRLQLHTDLANAPDTETRLAVTDEAAADAWSQADALRIHAPVLYLIDEASRTDPAPADLNQAANPTISRAQAARSVLTQRSGVVERLLARTRTRPRPAAPTLPSAPAALSTGRKR